MIRSAELLLKVAKHRKEEVSVHEDDNKILYLVAIKEKTKKKSTWMKAEDGVVERRSVSFCACVCETKGETRRLVLQPSVTKDVTLES